MGKLLNEYRHLTQHFSSKPRHFHYKFVIGNTTEDA